MEIRKFGTICDVVFQIDNQQAQMNGIHKARSNDQKKEQWWAKYWKKTSVVNRLNDEWKLRENRLFVLFS